MLCLKYFTYKLRDIYTSQLSPHEYEFGHISDNPLGWEERFEKKDMLAERHQGKVRTVFFYFFYFLILSFDR